jgi:hypothetical protein
MGYRSDVGYKIKFDNWIEWKPDIPVEARQSLIPKDLFNTFLAEAKVKEETKRCFDDDDGVFKIDVENLAITFFAESVKWYESYSDVQCHEALLDLANEWIAQHQDDDRLIYSPVRWGFVRIGEESDDIEEKNNNDGYDLVYLTRGISFG